MQKFIFDICRRGRQFIIEGLHSGDNGLRYFEFIFSRAGKLFPLPKNCTATLFAILPDGTIIYDYCEVSENSVKYTLKGGTDTESCITSLSGTVECEIRITSPTGEVLTSPSFAVRVDSVLQDDSAIEASDSFSALTEALINVREIETTMPRNFVFVYDMDEDGAHDGENTANYLLLMEKLRESIPISAQVRAYNDILPASFIEAGNGIYKVVAYDSNYNESLVIKFKNSAEVISYSKIIPKDLQGSAGKDGLSAYETAKEHGFEGTEEEWLESLKGTDGTNGISATHEWNGTVLTIKSASGTSSADLKGEKGDKGETGEKGADGKDGADGKTPEKGVDYFTEEDKTELVASVLNALPTWEGGSY